MKNNSLNRNQHSYEIAKTLLWKMILTFVIYLLLGFVVFVLAELFFRSYYWEGTELIYILLKWCERRWDIFLGIYTIFGIAGIFWYFWKKPFQYLGAIMDASRNIYTKSETDIYLPPELSVLELEMNQLKYKVKENERVTREAEQRKNDLVAYLAHDLKTPITSVIGYLTLLSEEKEISPELREKYLQVAITKAERLDDLINEFFEITRFNLSNIPLEYSQINLTRMLEQVLFEFEPIFAEKSLSYRLNAPKDCMVSCDGDKLQRVFDNLLRNAVNYSFAEKEIVISLLLNGDNIHISVENEGNPISADKLSRIFERFYRLDSARASGSGGAGLGLAIAKEIIEQHQGRIYAQSQGNQIRFEIVFPHWQMVRNS